jgi:hypothetical protein
MVGVQQPLQFQGVTSDCKVSVWNRHSRCAVMRYVQKIIDDDWDGKGEPDIRELRDVHSERWP